jgi:16S rRNA (cytidine1402-2'-O)-methyltransferase
MGRLYIVSTPIGNLGDITYRAVEVLGQVSRVLAEDTRRTAVLFRRYGIETPLVSAHAHNEAARAQLLLSWLDAGEEIALVSDAGTPLLSDPGHRLVRAALDGGHAVEPVPGASALLAALVASGMDPAGFTFVGFPPRSGGARTRVLDGAAAAASATVFYEAPSRLARLLADLHDAAGAERPVVVAREVTKLHEEFFRGTMAEALTFYEDRNVRGEIVVILGPAGEAAAAVDEADAAVIARELVAAGLSPTAVARELTRRLGIPRRQTYPIARSAAAEREEEES